MILMRIRAAVVGAELRQLHRRQVEACIRGVLSKCSGVLADRRGNGGRPDDIGIAGDDIGSGGDGIRWCWSGEPAG